MVSQLQALEAVVYNIIGFHISAIFSVHRGRPAPYYYARYPPIMSGRRINIRIHYTLHIVIIMSTIIIASE